MGSNSMLLTLVSVCAVLLAGVFVNATDAVSGKLDVFGKVVWIDRRDGDITYNPAETLEVSIDHTSTTSWHDLALRFFDKSDNLLDLTKYSIIYSVSGILTKTTAPSSSQRQGRANLPIKEVGETNLTLREEATGLTQELFTVRVTPKKVGVLKDIELASREIFASIYFVPGAVLEVPTYYKDKYGKSAIDLIFTDKAGNRFNMNDYSLVYSVEGVLGSSDTAAEWITKGHARLPILKSGKTDITLKENASDLLQKALTVEVYDWRN